MFAATQWNTAEDKAKFFGKYKKFVLGGFQQKDFTKKFYTRINMMFCHIAHYDQSGFYETWCSDNRSRLAFLNRHSGQDGVGVGDPTYTWSDVEKAIRTWINTDPQAIKTKSDLDTAISDGVEKTERAELNRLLNKYPSQQAWEV